MNRDMICATNRVYFFHPQNERRSNNKMRSKISRGSPVNETESIFGSKSSGVDEDWFLSECPRFALAVRFDRFAQSNERRSSTSRNFDTSLNSPSPSRVASAPCNFTRANFSVAGWRDHSRFQQYQRCCRDLDKFSCG